MYAQRSSEYSSGANTAIQTPSQRISRLSDLVHSPIFTNQPLTAQNVARCNTSVSKFHTFSQNVIPLALSQCNRLFGCGRSRNFTPTGSCVRVVRENILSNRLQIFIKLLMISTTLAELNSCAVYLHKTRSLITTIFQN
jgi:hypothetical protein